MAGVYDVYDATRAGSETRRGDKPPDPPAAAAPLHELTTKQRSMLVVIDQYSRATGEACPGSYLARRMNLHHSTVQKHLTVLHRKGWLRSANTPVMLARTMD